MVPAYFDMEALDYRDVDGKELDELLTGSTITGAEPVDYPDTDGTFVYLEAPTGERSLLMIEPHPDKEEQIRIQLAKPKAGMEHILEPKELRSVKQSSVDELLRDPKALSRLSPRDRLTILMASMRQMKDAVELLNASAEMLREMNEHSDPEMFSALGIERR